MTRVISNILTPLVFFVIAFGFRHNVLCTTGSYYPADWFIGLVAAVFGFWLSYTGWLARMFRKVG